MSFVRNAWYVAGWSTDFDHDLVPLTLLAQNLVMFRCSDGNLAALEDRCPHRLLPLSKGKRIGDTIQCGYHGMTFGADGKCVRVPGQSNLPASAYVDSFPVLERHGIVFVWMGDTDKADPALAFDMPELSQDGWHLHHGDKLHIKANYLNVAENLVDPAHVSFVHPTTLGNAASENVPVHVKTADEVIVAWRGLGMPNPLAFLRNSGVLTGTWTAGTITICTCRRPQ